MGDSLRRFMGSLGRKSCVSSTGIQHVSFDILLTIPSLLPLSFREVHHKRKAHLELLAERRAVSTFCLIDLGCRILLTVILYLNMLWILATGSTDMCPQRDRAVVTVGVVGLGQSACHYDVGHAS